MIAACLNVLKPLLSISINYYLSQVCGCGIVVNNRSSGDSVSGSSPRMGDPFINLFNISINDHSKYQNTVFFIFKLISKRK